ncbi:MAG: bifunctional enoyl-CoA hydratase/phosphate acetyltransferase [Rhodospirillaceae bacterium]|nr:bifunctional enoyl-CoA hydratase/phosphate acetyltransferase [Rhodospirillaceae bacterium]
MNHRSHPDRQPDLLGRLTALRGQMKPTPCAVVHPCDVESVSGAHQASQAGLIDPVLVGPQLKIARALDQAGIAAGAMRIVATEHSHAAADKAVAMARAGEVAALMKGSLHTDELMGAAIAAEGLRTARRMSHVFVMDVPAYDRLLLITDAAINIDPDLDCKSDIVRNAIDLAHALGVRVPRVAILSAVETVSARIPSTIDAAALCKMADRGQITGGILDGPLAFDNAISVEAAQQKGIVSQVAGRADILIVPDLEAGNMLAKQLSYFGGADSAGIVMGARCPIALTSRADSIEARLASAALLGLVAAARGAAAPIST